MVLRAIFVLAVFLTAGCIGHDAAPGPQEGSATLPGDHEAGNEGTSGDQRGLPPLITDLTASDCLHAAFAFQAQRDAVEAQAPGFAFPGTGPVPVVVAAARCDAAAVGTNSTADFSIVIIYSILADEDGGPSDRALAFVVLGSWKPAIRFLEALAPSSADILLVPGSLTVDGSNDTFRVDLQSADAGPASAQTTRLTLVSPQAPELGVNMTLALRDLQSLPGHAVGRFDAGMAAEILGPANLGLGSLGSGSLAFEPQTSLDTTPSTVAKR